MYRALHKISVSKNESKSMPFPDTQTNRLRLVSLETARMSYPSSMSRGKNPPVPANGESPKKRMLAYFERRFPLQDVWDCEVENYDVWHSERVWKLGDMLRRRDFVGPGRNSRALAAKFLNTYMHQLMKYEECRHLWPSLHLPLDQRVFVALKALKSDSLAGILELLSSSPYELRYSRHLDIQSALLQLINELNDREPMEFQITSRIELNWLWA